MATKPLVPAVTRSGCTVAISLLAYQVCNDPYTTAVCTCPKTRLYMPRMILTQILRLFHCYRCNAKESRAIRALEKDSRFAHVLSYSAMGFLGQTISLIVPRLHYMGPRIQGSAQITTAQEKKTGKLKYLFVNRSFLSSRRCSHVSKR